MRAIAQAHLPMPTDSLTRPSPARAPTFLAQSVRGHRDFASCLFGFGCQLGLGTWGKEPGIWSRAHVARTTRAMLEELAVSRVRVRAVALFGDERCLRLDGEGGCCRWKSWAPGAVGRTWWVCMCGACQTASSHLQGCPAPRIAVVAFSQP
eukprot:3034531-Rhodomonas_salina.1